MNDIKTVSSKATIEEIIKIIELDGCVVLEDILGKRNLETLCAEMSHHLNETQDCQGDFYGYKTKRISGLISKSKMVRSLAIHEKLTKVMDHFLLKSCDAYQLNLTQAISIGPEEPKQILHRDDAMYPFEKRGVETMVNCAIALDDFTEENGSTNLVPGSHKWNQERIPKDSEVRKGVMKAGSVLIYLGSLIHGGGHNQTSSYRTGVWLGYNCGWLRQAENHYLAIPKEEVASYSAQLQRLLGYFVHKPNLGSVNGRDPIELLTNPKNVTNLFSEYIPESVRGDLREFRQVQSKNS